MKLFAAIRWLVLVAATGSFFAFGQGSPPPVVIAQLSDTHFGEPRAPHAAENLGVAVQMINARHPDAVILTGDIDLGGES